MTPIDKLSYNQILDQLLNKRIHITSDCELFPNFDLKGKIKSAYVFKSEIIMNFEVEGHNKRTIKVGSNMRNLKYEFI